MQSADGTSFEYERTSRSAVWPEAKESRKLRQEQRRTSLPHDQSQKGERKAWKAQQNPQLEKQQKESPRGLWLYQESDKNFDSDNFHLDLEQMSINDDSLDGDLSEIDWSDEETKNEANE